MSEILERLRNDPQLLDYVHELNEFVDEEARRRQEFYDRITEDDKIEFINGEIIVQSPARREHIDVTVRIGALLKAYVGVNQGGFVAIEKCLITLSRNDYEPEIVWFGPEKSAAFTRGQLQFPAPDLAVEVLSRSTEQIDRGVKFKTTPVTASRNTGSSMPTRKSSSNTPMTMASLYS